MLFILYHKGKYEIPRMKFSVTHDIRYYSHRVIEKSFAPILNNKKKENEKLFANRDLSSLHVRS